MSDTLFLEVFPTGPIQANCVLIGDREAGVVAVVDPGEEAEMIADRVRASGLEPCFILHTHGHLDHAGGTAELKRLLGNTLKVGLHPDEVELYNSLPTQGQMFGFQAETPPEPDLDLVHGSEIEIGRLKLEVRHTPGHSPGGVCFVVIGAAEPLVIAGDVLFAGSIGRTDLWGGSFEILAKSIREQLYTLPDDTRVICGHGPDTTIAHEKATNPFVSG
ncbi:MAG: MBL fold metallo-hydrolase [bacterium]|nr:MBL fold metallo-hydrolase [bacterium]